MAPAPSGPLANSSDDELGRKLLRENMLSLASRYNDAVDEAAIRSYRYDHARAIRVLAASGAPRTVAIIKAFHCYAYQTCEHNEWEESETKAICDRIVNGLCHRLDGYDKAPWGFDEAPSAPKTASAHTAAVGATRAVVAKLEAPAQAVIVHEDGKAKYTGFVSFKCRGAL